MRKFGIGVALGPNKKKSSFARQYFNLSDTCLNTETTQTPQKDAALYKQKGMGQSPPSHKTDCLSHYSLCVSAKMLLSGGGGHESVYVLCVCMSMFVQYMYVYINTGGHNVGKGPWRAPH